MSKTNTVTSYLTGISQVRDDLVVVRETVSDADLVRIALNGFLEIWDTFVKVFVSRENLSNWERLWDDSV